MTHPNWDHDPIFPNTADTYSKPSIYTLETAYFVNKIFDLGVESVPIVAADYETMQELMFMMLDHGQPVLINKIAGQMYEILSLGG
jgi:hypothetical protein